MAQATNDRTQQDERRHEWMTRIGALVDEIENWARQQGWQACRDQKTIREKEIGDYEAPTLLVRLPAGELRVNPIGLQAVGANGRIDLEAFPTLSRVKLVGTPNGWQIVTDSNVPIRAPWNSETFVQLVHDLIA